jgi:tripartite-type tricarboxylate transporter receptor subunit TctC
MLPDRMRSCVWTAAALAAALSVTMPRADAAEPDELFYKGKTINFYIGFAGGGSYDFYARLIARFIGKYIPGNPTVVPQTMTGAGSFQLANYLFASAPKDGTALGTVTQTVALEEALHSPGVRYKAAEFNWIGRATAILEIALAGKDAKAKTIAAARQYETPVAGTGSGSPSEGYPRLMNALTGTKFKIISGYPGSTQAMKALEAGEVDGAFSSWNTLKRTRQEGLRNHELTILYQCALERHPDLADIPTDVELAATDEARQVLAFYTSSAAVGRSIVAPPGIPPERVNVLRRAFDATIRDPEFLGEIERAQQEFQPASGEELQQIIQDTAGVPHAIVERTEAILRSK